MRTADCHSDRKHYAKGKCRNCYERTRPGARTYRATHKDRINARSTAWAKENPGRRSVIQKKSEAGRRMSGATLRGEARREWYLMKQYGITTADYDRRLEDQGGVCALCGKKPGRVRLAIDHDHWIEKRYGTIVINGLLHTRENHSLGPFEYDLDVLQNTIEYLTKMLDRRKRYMLEYDPPKRVRKENT